MTLKTRSATVGTPVPRDGVYELYWYFAAERQAMYERRLSGAQRPWTADPILHSFKFCNVFRATDRVSQYMIQNVCYHNEACSVVDRLFQIVAFRTFSRIETWEGVRSYLGRYPTLDDLASGAFGDALSAVKQSTGGLYTGAFILCATDAFGQGVKHLNHVELFRQMFLLEDLGEALLSAGSLRQVYDLLHSFPLMGDFMSYQTAIDLNYSELINFSENEFTQPGPGAVRGLKKVFESLGGLSPSEAILWMVRNQEAEFSRLGLQFDGLFGRPLQAIDAQGLFCEVDKYCREAVPDLASARKRIKARYSTIQTLDQVFLPPKWKLNVPQATVSGDDVGSFQPSLF